MGDSAEKAAMAQSEVQISFKIIGPSPISTLSVCSPIKVHDLRKVIASNCNLSMDNLKLILRGVILTDTRNGEDVILNLNNGDSLMVATIPRPPPKHVQDVYDDNDDDLKFQIPQSASWLKRRLFFLLQDKLRLPDIMLMAIFSISIKAWVMCILWFVMAPISYKWDVGPLYIIGTAFAIIFLNLGQRQDGDLSAYSIFNENFRELPGTLNAERVDRDIRAGQF